ncbi:riboflavin synthase [Verrucomicrobia bacterium LW23]|nr:riboflavin synthase [Verrucomicrobia bacterium LW23]
MFTGLVEGTGTVISRTPNGVPGGGTRLVIDAGAIAQGVAIGDSISTNGCCLTVVKISGHGQHHTLLSFDLLAETEAVTNLKALREGSAVNLERSLRADARLGGHFVTGHVDCTGSVVRFARVGQDVELRVAVPPVGGLPGTRYLVPKGCIAVDGISLTVAEVAADSFTVWIIPHTREVTALRERSTGDEVNLEFDLIAKYTEKILAGRATSM